MKRRNFFQIASLSAAGLTLATSCCNSKTESDKSELMSAKNISPEGPPVYRSKIKSSFSQSQGQAASDKVILALIGAGNYGTYLTLSIVDLHRNIQIKYICDVDDTRGGRALSEIEKKQGFRPIRVRDMRKVFDDKEVDGVIIATPQHWHALASIWAMQAGKDVYVEKCISLTIGEGQKMVEAAMKYERILQCGTQNRSALYNIKARDYIKSGELGQIVAIDAMELEDGPIPFRAKEDLPTPDSIDWDMWLGPAPKVPYSISRNKSWMYYWDYSGGGQLGLGSIHQMDLIRFVLGNPDFPKSVYSTGGRYLFNDNRDVPDYQTTTYDFGNFVVSLQTGAFTPYMSKSSDKVRNGDFFPEWKLNSEKIVIYGTKRVMYLGRMGAGWQVFDKDGQVAAQEYGRHPLNDHLSNFIDCIRSRQTPNSDVVEGHKSSVLVHLANLSYRTGCRQLVFSPESELILNDSKARSLAEGYYRRGFEISGSI